MSNTSKGPGTKGSKFWMQKTVNTPELKQRLDETLGDCLQWISPLEYDDFAEYELRQACIYEKLGLDAGTAKSLFSFWPGRQPQWDGIGFGQNGRRLYLVEAKAHCSELQSSSAASEKSWKIIQTAMDEVIEAEGYEPTEDGFKLWRNGYYQLANRLTFLSKLQGMLPAVDEVRLVLLNFTGDYTHISETEEEFREHYRKVFKEMTGKYETPKNVDVVCMDVSDIFLLM